MARSSGCSLLAALAVASCLTAYGPEQRTVAAAPPAPPPAKPDDKAAPPAPPAPQPVAGACTRKRAEADLRARSPGRSPTRGQIDAELQRCFRDRLAECQLALDADVDEGLACWKQAPWPEVPASVEPAEITKTGTCLVELKAVIADLRSCRTKKPAARDACVTPYIGYTPDCGLLKAERVWRMFPGREDVERVAKADAERRDAKDPKAAREQAAREAKESKESKLKADQATKDAKLKADKEAKDAKLKADQEAKDAKLKADQEAKDAKLKTEQEARKAAEEAKLAKESERCHGRTTIEFAEKLKAAPGPRSVPGCKYQVSGTVLSRNREFAQVAGPGGAAVFLLRTKEPFAEGDPVADRTATFDAVQEIELADGSKRPFAVFKLEPAPKPKQ